MAEKGKEVGEFVIEGQHHGSHFRRIRAHLMAKNVVGGKAYGQQIGGFSGSEIFINHQLFGEFQLVLVGEGRGADHVGEARFGTVFIPAMRG